MRGQGRIEEAAACARDALAMARALGDANAEQEYARLLDSLSGESVGQAGLT
jgi:hypothetical protein